MCHANKCFCNEGRINLSTVAHFYVPLGSQAFTPGTVSFQRSCTFDFNQVSKRPSLEYPRPAFKLSHTNSETRSRLGSLR